MTKLLNYTAESCHHVGYGWTIKAPATIHYDQVERIVEAVVSWTDHPDQKALSEMLADKIYLEGYGIKIVPELTKIEIDINGVHRESFHQSFRER